MVRQLGILIVLAGGLLMLLGPQAADQEAVAFEVDNKARLVDAGQAVDVQVTVTCPAGAEVLEAFFYVTQDGNQSRLTFFQPVCDGTLTRSCCRPRQLTWCSTRARRR